MISIRYKFDGESYGVASVDIPDTFELYKFRQAVYIREMALVNPLREWANMALWKFKVRDRELTDFNQASFEDIAKTEIIFIYVKKTSLHPRPEPEIQRPVQRRRITKKHMIVPGISERTVDMNSPPSDIRFGEYCHRMVYFAMDNQAVNLTGFPLQFRGEFFQRLVAKIYREITDLDDTISKMVMGSTILNIFFGKPQTGKTKLSCFAVFLDYFQSIIPCYLVMNVGGDGHIHRVRKEIASIFCPFVENLVRNENFDFHTSDIIRDFFKIELKSAKELRKWKKHQQGNSSEFKPFGFIGHYNKPSINTFEKNRFFGSSDANLRHIGLISDEDHDFRQHPKGETGVAEKRTFLECFGGTDIPFRHLVVSSVSFTATPFCLLYTQSDSNLIYTNLINLADPANHVGFSQDPKVRGIRLVETNQTVPLSENQSNTILTATPGVLDMIAAANLGFKYETHISCIVSTRLNRGNNAKSLESCPLFLSKAPSAVVFTICQENDIDFHFNFSGNRSLLIQELNRIFCLHFTFKSVTVLRVTAAKVPISFYYDVVEAICRFKAQKFYSISIAGNSAKLGNTHKPSNHSMSLNFGFMETNSDKYFNLEAFAQMIGRLQSNDNYIGNRFLFMDKPSCLKVSNLYDLRKCIMNTFSGLSNETIQQIMERLHRDTPDHLLLKYLNESSDPKLLAIAKTKYYKVVVEDYEHLLHDEYVFSNDLVKLLPRRKSQRNAVIKVLFDNDRLMSYVEIVSYLKEQNLVVDCSTGRVGEFVAVLRDGLSEQQKDQQYDQRVGRTFSIPDGLKGMITVHGKHQLNQLSMTFLSTHVW